MKTAIIETHYHSEYLSTLLSLYQKSDVFTIKSVYNDLPESSKQSATFNFPGTSSIKSFINSINTSDYDLLFVNTIQETLLDLHNWKDFKPKCTSVLTIHNLNAWHNTTFKPRFNLVHSFDSWFSSRPLKKILHSFDYLSVCYEPMISVAQKYFTKPVVFTPFALAQQPSVKDQHDDIWFTIPGTVSHKRRNYLPVLDAFEKLLSKHHDIRLYLLGNNEDNLEFESFPENEDRIVTFSGSVPRDDYDNYLCNSDFIVIPSIEYTHTINVSDERYGYTKSPNIHDAIKWRKPVIVPRTLPTPFPVLSYDNADDLYVTLHNLLSDEKKQANLKRQAVVITKPYTLEKTKLRLEKELVLR